MMEFKKFVKHPVFWMVLSIVGVMVSALIYKPDFTDWDQSNIQTFLKIVIIILFIVVSGVIIKTFIKK